MLEAKVRKENLDGVRARCFPNSWLIILGLKALQELLSVGIPACWMCPWCTVLLKFFVFK